MTNEDLKDTIIEAIQDYFRDIDEDDNVDIIEMEEELIELIENIDVDMEKKTEVIDMFNHEDDDKI